MIYSELLTGVKDFEEAGRRQAKGCEIKASVLLSSGH